MFDMRFRNPSSFILGGASQSGKTTFTFNILRNIDILFQDPRCQQNVIYFYKTWQKSYEIFDKEKIVTSWVNRLPTAQDVEKETAVYKDRGGSIIVIDDFAQDLTKTILDLFAVLCHHTNSVVFLLTQNIFSKNKVFRDISLNSTYVVLFKNPRDASQISSFARQFAPGKNSDIVDMFKLATKAPHSYVLFDFYQSTPDNLRVRSRVLPHEGPLNVWVSE